MQTHKRNLHNKILLSNFRLFLIRMFSIEWKTTFSTSQPLCVLQANLASSILLYMKVKLHEKRTRGSKQTKYLENFENRMDN